MAKITRIKAGDSSKKPPEAPEGAAKNKVPKDQALDKKAQKAAKKAQKREKRSKKPKKTLPKPLRIITAPFRALGRYIHNSWLELRQVRWPSRKATWKMVLAVFVYAGLIMTLVMLLDAFFTWLFNLILG